MGDAPKERHLNQQQDQFQRLLDDSQPPTLLLPGQEEGRGIRFPVWLDGQGRRVAADCPGAVRKIIDVWPLPLEP